MIRPDPDTLGRLQDCADLLEALEEDRGLLADAPAELRWQAVDTRFSAPAARVYGDAAKGGKA